MTARERATHIYKLERSKLFDPKDPLSEQFFLTTKDQASKFYDQQNDHICYLKSEVEKDLLPDEVVSQTSVYEKHRYVMKNNKDFCDSNIACLLPKGENLRTWLETDQWSTNTWQQPMVNKDQLDNNHCITEFSIPHFKKKKFEFSVNEFNNSVNFTRQTLFNATPLAFSVQSVRIPRSEYKKLVKGATDGRNRRESVNLTFHHVKDVTNGDTIKFPTKFVIATRNISLVFKFGLTELESVKNDANVRNLLYEYSTIPDEVLDFFKLLPPLYAVNAVLEMNMLENILADLYGIDGDSDVKFRSFDLLGLALANGCRMNVSSKYALSALCLGKPFPVLVDSFDENWALDLSSIQTQYLKEKNQLYFDAYTILMGLLLRNIHPDPYIILVMTEMSQNTFISWFSEFIAASLEDCSFPSSFSVSDSRVDMLARIGNDSRAPLKYLLDLIIDVPVASFGGARFLHHILHKSGIQYSALSKIRLPNYTGEAPNLNKDIENDIHALKFKREYANDSGEPTEMLGLNASPSCEDSLYNLDLKNIELFVLPDRDSKLIFRIKEWGRLNVEKIPLLFHKIKSLATDVVAKSWLKRIDLYAYLSDLYFYMKGVRITVSSLEQSLMIRKLNVEVTYENSRLKAEKVLMKYDQRLDVLHHQPGKYGVHQRVQAIVPGDFTKDNRAKAGQKKRRIQRAQEYKRRKGESWISHRELVNEKRVDQLNAAGYHLGSTGARPSTSHGPRYANNDLRNLLEEKENKH